MTKRRQRAIALVVAALALAAVGFYLFQRRTAPLSPTVLVPVTWTTARGSPMHVLHLGKQVPCESCHGDSSTVPTATVCAQCHAGETKTVHHGAAGAETTCLTCHAFGLQAPATCTGCHAKDTRAAAAPRLEHHASPGLPCGSCHSVHAQKTERVVLADCTRCHAERAMHGRFTTASSAHGSPTAATDRDAAMAIEGDAAALAFVRSESPPVHASLPADPLAATPGQVCSSCHTPHSGKEEARARCVTCHVGAPPAPAGASAPAAPQVVPRGHDTASHASCTTCHAPHDAVRGDVRACDSCHEDHRGAAQNPGHAACIGCHTPHAPAEAKTSCTTCHAQVKVLAASKVAAHTDCTSCHDPHKPGVPPSDACARCHSSMKPSHPPTPSAHGKQTCTGCHAPHGKQVEPPIAATCTSCHTKLGNDHAAHDKKLACTQCHKPHEFALAGLGPKLCAGCHQAKVTAVSTRPGHANCDGCHGKAHDPVPKPGCASCHAAEAKSAPKGHATCTGCHDPHSGDRGNRAVCTNCHTDKANALHAKATPQGCASCHTAHGPKGVLSPPACTTCHAPTTLKGLHAIGGHATCKTCHQAHGPPRFDRATCTGTCHTDHQNHQPQAKVCKGCHLFHD